MDRKEFLKRASGLGVCGCAATLFGVPGLFARCGPSEANSALDLTRACEEAY